MLFRLLPFPLRRSLPTSSAFYSTVKKPVRRYYYFLDHHGLLFLDGEDDLIGQQERPPPVRNITSCYKDVRFLNFFFSRLKPAAEVAAATAHKYKFVSRCAGEANYLACDDTPIVFRDVVHGSGSSDAGHLVWAGSLSTPFLPCSLVMSRESGRLYHPSPPEAVERGLPNMSLVASSILLQWVEEGKLDVEKSVFRLSAGDRKEFPINLEVKS